MQTLSLTLCIVLAACQQAEPPKVVTAARTAAATPAPEAPTPDDPAVATAVEVAITYCIP